MKNLTLLDQLAGTKIFEAIPKEAVASLLEVSKEQFLASGETLFADGDISDGIYFVVSGSLKIFATKPDGTLKLVTDVGRGEIIGEMSLLMNRAHIHTVKAVRDSQVIFLSKTLFHEIIERFPKTLRLITERIIQRYETLLHGCPDKLIPKTLAFLSAGDSGQLEDYIQKFMMALGPKSRVKRLTSKDVKSSVESEVVFYLSELEHQYDFLIYQCDNHLSDWSKRCIREADRVFLIAEEKAHPQLNAIEKELFTHHLPKTHKRVELVILHPQKTTPFSNTGSWLELRPVFQSQHVHLENENDLRRQVRFLKGEAIGVVLGGGGVRCFSQVGFLRAMEEENIPIDMICGCSGGAIVASLSALGLNADEIERSCWGKFSKYKPLSHYELPLVSLINDKYIRQIAHELYRDTSIEDLPINFFSVSCDIVKAQKIIHRSGKLAEAVVASMSIPGIFPPVILEGQFLVDGGLMDNLPVKTLKEIFDGKIIAIDASPTEEFLRLRIPKKMPKKLELVKSWVNPFRKHDAMPSIKDILTRSILVNAAHERLNAPIETPYAMNMPVENFPILEISKIPKIIKIGYEHAKPIVSQWKKLNGLGA